MLDYNKQGTTKNNTFNFSLIANNAKHNVNSISNTHIQTIQRQKHTEACNMYYYAYTYCNKYKYAYATHTYRGIFTCEHGA